MVDKNTVMQRVKLMEEKGVPEAEIRKYLYSAMRDIDGASSAPSLSPDTTAGAAPMAPVASPSPSVVSTATETAPTVAMQKSEAAPQKKGIFSRVADVVNNPDESTLVGGVTQVAQSLADTMFSPFKKTIEIAKDAGASVGSQKTGGLTQKTAEFGDAIGLGGVGRFVGKQFFDMTPEGVDLQSRLNRGEITEEEYQQIAGQSSGMATALFSRETIGSAIQTALLLASPSMPSARSAGEALMMGASKSAARAIGTGLEQKQTVKEMLFNVPAQSLIGSITEIFLYGLGKGFNYLTEKAPEGLYRGTLGQSPSDLTKETRLEYKEPALNEQMRKLRWVESDATIFNGAMGGVKYASDQVDDLVARAAEKGVTVDATGVIRSLDDRIEVALESGDKALAKAISEYKNGIIEGWKAKGHDITAIAIDEAKSFIDSSYTVLGEKAGAVGDEASRLAARRAAAGAMRRAVGDVSPELDAAIYEQQFWVRSAKAVAHHLFQNNAEAEQVVDTMLGTHAVIGKPGVTAAVGTIKSLFHNHLGARAAAVWLDGVNEVVKWLPTTPMKQTARVFYEALWNAASGAMTEATGGEKKSDTVKDVFSIEKAKEYVKSNPKPR